MQGAIEDMAHYAAPHKKCRRTFKLNKCSLYGHGHTTFGEMRNEGFGIIMQKYTGSIFAVTLRDPGDRLLSLVEFLHATKNTNGSNETALQIFEDDLKRNVGGHYTKKLQRTLKVPIYNLVCVLAHEGGFSEEDCKDAPEHLTKTLPKAIAALRSFDVVGLTDDFAASALMTGLISSWDPSALHKYVQKLPISLPVEQHEYDKSKREIPHRMCWANMHKQNQQILLQSYLFQAEIKLFQEARKLHFEQLQRLSNNYGETFNQLLIEFRKKHDANSVVASRSCNFTTLP